MNKEIIEAYILTQDELRILLQIAECKMWYGFEIIERAITEDEAIHLIYRMVEKEFLYSDGEILHVNKYLSEAMRVLKNAYEVLCIEDGDNELPMYCCYLGENVLLSEWMSQRKDTVKLKLCDKNDLYQLLEDEGYFQKYRNFAVDVLKNPEGISECRIYNQDGIICLVENENRQMIEFDDKWIRNFFTKLLNKDVKKLDWSNL